MHLSGQLSDWSIHDLLQIMQVTKKTGSLDIDGDRRGRIHFRSGAVTGAELSGTRGSYSGQDRGTIADILYVLSTLESGAFSIGPADGPETSGLAVDEVVGDLEALRKLEGEVVDAGLFEAAGIRLKRDLGEPLTIQPDDWQVIGALVQPFSFSNLEAQVGRGGAVRLVHTLHRLGIADAVDDLDDEASLLGKVAGSVSGEPPVETAEPVAAEPTEPVSETVVEPEPEPEPGPEPEPVPAPAAAVTEPDSVEVSTGDIDVVTEPDRHEAMGVSAPASTTLTDGVYDEIRRLRSKVAER